MHKLLGRYSPEQLKTIEQYWGVISRNTRKNGSVSQNIKLAELKYWDGFEVCVVIEALKRHICQHPGKKESYTRGIMRNIADEWEFLNSVDAGLRPSARRAVGRKKNRVCNFEGRELDYEVIEHIEILLQTGQLDACRDKLVKDPRYAKYLT
jgi:hypothetical protein